jgi:hypothetical protein
MANISRKRLFNDGQKVMKKGNGKIGTVKKLYREPYYFNKNFQYYIIWNNGNLGIVSEDDLLPLLNSNI